MADVAPLLDGYAQRYMVCEAPADPQGFTTACGSAFAFDHNKHLVGRRDGDAPRDPRGGRLLHLTAPPGDLATMLSNHDSFAGDAREDQVGGDAPGTQLAAATYLLQPGTPFIYYGEEIGMAAGAA